MSRWDCCSTSMKSSSQTESRGLSCPVRTGLKQKAATPCAFSGVAVRSRPDAAVAEVGKPPIKLEVLLYRMARLEHLRRGFRRRVLIVRTAGREMGRKKREGASAPTPRALL